VCRAFLFYAILCNTSSFPTRSVQLITATLLQHHISKRSKQFRYTFAALQVAAPHKAVTQTLHSTSICLKSNSKFLIEETSFKSFCSSHAGFHLIIKSCIFFHHCTDCNIQLFRCPVMDKFSFCFKEIKYCCK